VSGAAPLPDIEIEDAPPGSADAVTCLSHYFAELGERFEAGFDADKSLAPTLDGFEPPDGLFLVIRRHGEPVACGGFKRDGPEIAYLKRMWVSREARGLGLGRRLLTELERRAAALGYRTIRLETEKSLAEAQQLYRSSGYVEVPPFNDELYAHHWFEKTLEDRVDDQ
jgi:ribosomal protein S18 acetylase RimI-like enzyme